MAVAKSMFVVAETTINTAISPARQTEGSQHLLNE